jgi:hypothetical protein
MGRRRTLIPASGLLTTLKGLVGSGRLKGNSKNTPERSAPPPCDAEKENSCGDLIPGVLDGKEPFVSGANATESCVRSVEDPSSLNEAASAMLSATSDDRLNALSTEGIAGRVAVVLASRDEDIQMAVQPTAIANNTWGVIDFLPDLAVIAGIRQRGVGAERNAVSVQEESVLCRQFPAVNWTWAGGGTAAEFANLDAVDDRNLGFENAGLPEQHGKVCVEIVSGSSFDPSSKSVVSGAPRTAELDWRVLPSAFDRECIPGVFGHHAVLPPRAAVLRLYGLLRSQQSLLFREEPIRHPSACQPGALHGSQRL